MLKYLLLLKLTIAFPALLAAQVIRPGTGFQEVYIQWDEARPEGTIEVLNGELVSVKITCGQGKAGGNSFKFRSGGENCLLLSFGSVHTEAGSGATLVTVNSRQDPFSFFLRDVSKQSPVYIPEYHVAVLVKDDNRTFREIGSEIRGRSLRLKLQQIENEPETSFESVENLTRDQSVPTWLGISRDIRIFQVSQALEDTPGETDVISPRNSSAELTVPGSSRTLNYSFTAGRGQGVGVNVHRRLEEGTLPILHSYQNDGEIEYHSTAFVTLENQLLNGTGGIGTDFLVADYFSSGHMFTGDQQVETEKKVAGFRESSDEQTVLFCRVAAQNTGKVPRYAWFMTPRPGRGWWDKFDYRFDREKGFSGFSGDRVFCISMLEQHPLSDEELAVLLQPGEKVNFEFRIPHSPIPEARAYRLASRSFDEALMDVKTFWQNKLQKAAQISLPEKRIEEMLQAGLLHLDLITYGKEPGGVLAPLIGVYSPIGTESAPIIQYYCSMGLFDQARRSLMYFLEKQHEDGLMQNFNGYMVETGAVLWSIGEYFRYTRDSAWIGEIKPRLLKSCEYLVEWRERNKKESLLGRGYGMIDGKVADPEDPYHQYMLNAYAYLGIRRTAEILRTIDPENSERLLHEALNWKDDILVSFYNSMAHAPVVPLGDGTWCPTVSPWTESTGPRSLYVENASIFSHGTFTVPDVLLGPLYLVFCEVLEPEDPASLRMLDYHSELFYKENAVFSQPYYSRHNWLQLKLGMVKPFLKTYYSTFSALADRETYTFWEHLYHASPHKTHEEGWFLMQTRWMLYMEEGETLRLLPGIPRKWLEDGEKIELHHVASYFGPVSLAVDPHPADGFIDAVIRCRSDRSPEKVILRLPHPGYKVPVAVEGGTYDGKTETVTIEPFTGEAHVRLAF